MARALWTHAHLNFCLVLISSSLVTAWAEEAQYEMDVVVTVKVTPANLPQAYMDSIRDRLHSDMRNSFPRMISSARLPSAGPDKDGAAKFRIFIDYAGTVTSGAQFSMKAEKSTNEGGSFTSRSWYLPVDVKGTFAGRLAKWSGTGYQDVVKFGGVVPKEAREPGPLNVFQRSTPTKNEGKDADVCPITVEVARNTALESALPPTLRASVYSKLVPITLQRATPAKMDGGKPSEMAVELKIENKSPWPLKSVGFTFVQGGMEFSVSSQSIALPTPLAPGQSTSVKTIARPGSASLLQGTQNAEFVVPTP